MVFSKGGGGELFHHLLFHHILNINVNFDANKSNLVIYDVEETNYANNKSIKKK